MTSRRTRRLLSLAALGFVAAAAAQPVEQKPRPDPHLDVYAKPGEWVDIGGHRRLNMRCSGKGAATVMLESGNNADSMTWFKVQPEIAKFAHVCSYDRAGVGFSDGGPLPRNVDTHADDLYALIRAAKIASPVILVGHSYGTNIVRRFADKHAADVAAIVLLDPPGQNVGEFAPEFDQAEEKETTEGLAVMRQCELGARNGQLDAPTGALKLCLRPPNPQLSGTLNAAQHANKIRPVFWQTMISITETNTELYKQPVSKSESHGAIPLLVLQPDTPFAELPAEIQKPMELSRQKTQQAIAATSTRGKIIAVAHSSHDVQMDRPDAVVQAVSDAIAASKQAAVGMSGKVATK